jgi:hypothetical protein
MIISDKYLVQGIETITWFDLSNNVCEFIFDDLQEAEMNVDSETIYAEGKNGTRIGATDRNKTSTFTATNGTVVDGALAVQVGSEVEKGVQTINNYMDIMTTADGTTATTEFFAVGATGAEIAYIYKKNSDGSLGDKYPIAATASATAFAYDPATRAITLPTGVFAAGDELVAFYDTKAKVGKRVVNENNKFSKTGKAIFDIFVKDICTDKSYHAKITYYKAKMSGTFSLTFGSDFSTHNIEVEALSGGCAKGASTILWDMVIYDEEDVIKTQTEFEALDD